MGEVGGGVEIGARGEESGGEGGGERDGGWAREGEGYVVRTGWVRGVVGDC